MLTSASAARQAGDGLTPFHALPCYAVGEATAAAAARGRLRRHPDRARRRRRLAADDGRGRRRAAFHACGEDHLALGHPDIAITRVPVYAAEAVDAPAGRGRGRCSPCSIRRAPPLCSRALARRPLRASRSPRSARGRRARRARAGSRVAVAPRPRDHALLELAAKLCQRAATMNGDYDPDRQRRRRRSGARSCAGSRCPASPSCSASA